jgi:hypothetical protein
MVVKIVQGLSVINLLSDKFSAIFRILSPNLTNQRLITESNITLKLVINTQGSVVLEALCSLRDSVM